LLLSFVTVSGERRGGLRQPRDAFVEVREARVVGLPAMVAVKNLF
jgi:hypothetical protein